ncbi:MAG: hypothetical protein JRC77_11160, partial [Deltaproteobacteria bacterium]|nr:hypothetical protein [Deltaproteobacteria bacterium]
LRSLSACLILTVLSATLLAQELHAVAGANLVPPPALLHAHADEATSHCSDHEEEAPAPLLRLRTFCPCGCSDPAMPTTPMAPLGQALLTKRSPAWIHPPEARLPAYRPALTPIDFTRIDHVPKSA